MKRIFTFCFILSLLPTLFAKEVSQQEAEKVAKNFFYQATASRGANFDDLMIKERFTIKEGQQTLYYAFNFVPEGFVIVSAEDNFLPIIGYNTEFSYQNEGMPDHVKSFFENYAMQIRLAIAEKNAPLYRERWRQLLSDDPSALETRSLEAVPPLGAPIWNQNYPYNYYCPTNNNGRAYAGCVATALHMCMYYWRWPLIGEGSHSYHPSNYSVQTANFEEAPYDWNGMPHVPGKTFCPEISRMMYHIGVSVDMMYGHNGSGAWSQDCPYSISTYFKYNPNAYFSERNSYSGDWMELLKEELSAGRMLYFSGCSEKGCHAFVCEGYNVDDYFYFNFGWSGAGNGYYALDYANSYASWQGALIGFEPDKSKGYPYYCEGLTIIPHEKGSIEDGSGPLENYRNNTNASWLIDPSAAGTPIEKVSIHFRKLSLAAGDYLRIYDGGGNTAPLLAEYTDTESIPESIESSIGKVFIEFITDDTQTAEGFHLEYSTTVAKACSGLLRITEPEGVMTDGSATGEYYAPRLQCMYQIDPDNGKPLSLQFNRFELANDGVDEVKVYTIYTSTDYRLRRTLKGTITEEIPSIYIATGNALITFVTNGTENSKGWELSWSEATEIEEQPTIESFNVFPNPATESLTVQFKAEQRGNLSITLYNMNGVTVYQEETPNFIGHYDNHLDVSMLPTGIYLLKISSNGDLVTQKVVIE